MCLDSKTESTKTLDSFLLSPCFPPSETTFHLPVSYQKPAILRGKAEAPTERQELERLHTEKQMLKPQTPGYHRVLRMASTGEQMFFQKTYSNPGQTCWVYGKSQWLLLYRMAVQVIGKAHALYVISKETDKGEMKCCNCTSIKAAQQRTIIPTRHCDNRTRAPFPVSQETAPIN